MKYYLKALKKYASFSGRASRKEYWYFILFHFLIILSLQYVGLQTHNNLLYTLYAVATLLPSLAVIVRRMHDVNKSGWFAIIPLYNLVLAMQAGTLGINQLGADPR